MVSTALRRDETRTLVSSRFLSVCVDSLQGAALLQCNVHDVTLDQKDQSYLPVPGLAWPDKTPPSDALSRTDQR